MTKALTLCLVGSVLALTACESMSSGKTYPAPYAHERTAGAMEAPAAEHSFEKRMTK